MTGDLPPSALEHRELVELPRAAWSVAAPARGLLRELAQRRRWPSAPPGVGAPWSVAGVEGSAMGFSTRLAATPPPAAFAVRAALLGLPPGTPDRFPGEGSALESLSDDPFGRREARRVALRTDSTLLWLRGLALAPRAAGSALLDAPSTGVRWRIELPAGASAVVDDRGRLLSLDLGARLSAAWDAHVVARAAERLTGAADLVDLAPPYWPAPGASPEARWGLATPWPAWPLDARGHLRLP